MIQVRRGSFSSSPEVLVGRQARPMGRRPSIRGEGGL